MNGYDQATNSILEPNAYTLFLILILLILGTGRNIEEHLSYLSNVSNSSLNAIKMMRTGIDELHTTVIAYNKTPN